MHADQIKATNEQNIKTIENLEGEKKKVQDSKKALESDAQTAEKDMKASGKAIERYKRENAEMSEQVRTLPASPPPPPSRACAPQPIGDNFVCGDRPD